jgi:hypothetical protein
MLDLTMQRRRTIAVGGYGATAMLSGLIGVATSVRQVAILRCGAWAARGLVSPPATRYALGARRAAVSRLSFPAASQ